MQTMEKALAKRVPKQKSESGENAKKNTQREKKNARNGFSLRAN